MRKLILTFLICPLLISCNILGSSQSGELIIELDPKVVPIDEAVNLVIQNETKQTYRYHHCGHTVERKINNEWEKHTSTGCAYGFAEEIKPGQKIEIEDLLLSPAEPGFYRVRVVVLTEDESTSDTRRTSEPVEFIDINTE